MSTHEEWYKEFKAQKIKKLIKRFEEDILYDCHSMTSKINRSKARAEIIEEGPQNIKLIVEHIAQKKYTSQKDPQKNPLGTAWVLFLSWWAKDLKIYSPQQTEEMSTWIKWGRSLSFPLKN